MGEIEHPAVKKKTDGSASGASSAAAPVAVEAAVRPSAADPSVERWKKKTAKLARTAIRGGDDNDLALKVRCA